jgi:hypothetical protein
MRNRLIVLATVVGLAVAATAQAGHHLWDFTEIYSNASGTIQYIELFTADNNEQGVGPFNVTAGGHTVNFVTNLPTALTANTWILIATPKFAGLPGAITPDYILPQENFFPTGGGTMNYAGGADIWNYGTVPTNGELALQRNGTSASNTPRNFNGGSGHVNLAAVPAVGSCTTVLLVGGLLLVSSGLLVRRRTTLA